MKLSNIGVDLFWLGQELEPGNWVPIESGSRSMKIKEMTLLINESSQKITHKWLNTTQFKGLFTNDFNLSDKVQHILMVRFKSIYGIPTIAFIHSFYTADIGLPYIQPMLNDATFGNHISHQFVNTIHAKELKKKTAVDTSKWSSLLQSTSDELQNLQNEIIQSNLSSVTSICTQFGINAKELKLDFLSTLKYPLSYSQLLAIKKTLLFHLEQHSVGAITPEEIAKCLQSTPKQEMIEVKANEPFTNTKTFTPIEMLDRYEDAAQIALKQDHKVIGKLVGQYCLPPISNAAITDYIKKHRMSLQQALLENPGKWQTIRTHFKSISKLV